MSNYVPLGALRATCSSASQASLLTCPCPLCLLCPTWLVPCVLLCLTCLMFSRALFALRPLAPHVPCVIRAVMFYVPCALSALVSHVLSGLSDVPHVLYVFHSLVLHVHCGLHALVPHVPCTVHVLLIMCLAYSFALCAFCTTCPSAPWVLLPHMLLLLHLFKVFQT